MKKYSITLQGHRTSISLESEFWDAVNDIAKTKNIALAQLITQIDEARIADFQTGNARNLSSAIRVYVLKQLTTS